MKKVSYIYDLQLHGECDRLPAFEGRASLVHSLIQSYGLLSHLNVVASKPAEEDDLLSFHSSDYVNFLKMVNTSEDLERYENEEEEYGFGYDCPIMERIFDLVTIIAGSSLTAAQELIDGTALTVLNWYGGWHHAQRSECEGFCYVNDVVLAIVKLRRKFQRVLYIDLDVHHGNGVENAFSFTKRVLTLSFHKFEPGFYPGTGDVTDIGEGPGEFYTVNVPLQDGIRDDAYYSLFENVTKKVISSFQPDAVVVQCGTDSLSGDRLGTFSLTLFGIGKCVSTILSWNLPVMFLGGGGYNLPNTARCWAYLTSIIVGEEISTDIPDNKYFTMYGPSFELHVSPSSRKDDNSEEYLNRITATIHEQQNSVQTCSRMSVYNQSFITSNNGTEILEKASTAVLCDKGGHGRKLTCVTTRLVILESRWFTISELSSV